VRLFGSAMINRFQFTQNVSCEYELFSDNSCCEETFFPSGERVTLRLFVPA
jgi:hypothetical protein